jgi:type VI secretion system protein ImpE
MVLEPPTDLRDLVWAPVQFQWANGGEASGHIPTRYPGTESQPDHPLRLARRTDWVERDGDYHLGLGLRMMATEAEECSLLECRTLEFNAEG